MKEEMLRLASLLNNINENLKKARGKARQALIAEQADTKTALLIAQRAYLAEQREAQAKARDLEMCLLWGIDPNTPIRTIAEIWG